MTSYLGLLEVSDLTWPLSFRYHLSGPFGGSQCELHVDAPSLFDEGAASVRLGRRLFLDAIAPAMSSSVQVDFLETVLWKVSTVPIVSGATSLSGQRLAQGSGRAHAAVMLLHSGDHDRYAARRFYAAGMPRDWQDDGLLTLEGAEEMQTIARGWINGMSVETDATDPQLLIYHRESVRKPPPTPFGAGFRRVRHIRVCQYTAPVPEPGNLLWP